MHLYMHLSNLNPVFLPHLLTLDISMPVFWGNKSNYERMKMGYLFRPFMLHYFVMAFVRIYVVFKLFEILVFIIVRNSFINFYSTYYNTRQIIKQMLIFLQLVIYCTIISAASVHTMMSLSKQFLLLLLMW